MSQFDINNLLQAGQFSTKRAKSPAPPAYRSRTPTFPDYPESASRHVPRSFEPRVPRSRRWPPPPSCEDEADAVAREHGSVVSEPLDEEPKSKGDPEQHPVLLEVHEFNPERRFVLLNKNDSDSESQESPQERPKVPRIVSNGEYEANTSRKKSNVPYEAAAAAAGLAAAGIAGGLAAKESISSQRRKSMSRQDLPPLDTKLAEDEYAPKVSRNRSASKTGPGDYFTTNPRPQADGLLSPQIIKHGAGRREREEKYVDYNRSANGAPTSPMQGRSRSNMTDDRRYEERYERGSASGPSYKRASSSYDGKDGSRTSAERGYVKSGSYKEESVPPGYERKNSSPEYPRGKDRVELSRRSSKRQTSPPRKETSRSSADEPRLQRGPSYRRRKSIIVQEEPPRELDPGRASDGARSRSRVPPSPNPSQRPFNEEPPSPRVAYTFPADFGRPTKPVAVPYPEDDLPLRTSRLSVQGNDRSAARSRSRAESIQGAGLAMPAMPILIPSTPGSPTERRNPPMSPPGPSFSVSSPTQQQFWQPGSFNPTENASHLDRPVVGSFRRYSEDANRGGQRELPACRRKKPVVGLNDWLGIPNCENFNICPDCYSSVFQNTSFEDQFKPFPFRPSDKPTACDFGSSPWYRIAWLMTLKHRKPDLRLFHKLSAAQANMASGGGPCPGPRRATRVWYSIRNPETKKTIPDFTVCYGCAKAVEALLPNLTGVFTYLNDSHTPTKDICALHFLGDDRRRFVLYFDALETTSDRALEREEMPDLQQLADEIERLSLYTECQQYSKVMNGNWHVMEYLPELTVCGECFDEVVRPRLDADNAVARSFFVKPQRLDAASCQLYSERMRDVFRRACRRDDFQYLEDKVLERRRVEKDIHAKIAALDKRGQNDAETEEEVSKLIREWQKWE